MSRQMSFFAHPLDAQRLQTRVLEQFPGLQIISPVVGTPAQVQPRPAEETISGLEKMLLVPNWARGRVVFEQAPPATDVPGARLFVRPRTSPVIEYRPSLWREAERRVSAGRLYWQFEGRLGADESRQLDRLFRWVREQTRPLPSDRRFRIFEEAGRWADLLDDGYGAVGPNPFRTEAPGWFGS